MLKKRNYWPRDAAVFWQMQSHGLNLKVGVLTNPSSTEVKNKYANCSSMERLQCLGIKSGINMLWKKRLLLLAYLLKAIHNFTFLFPMHLNLRALERFNWTWSIFNKARTGWKLDFLLHMAKALCHLLKRGKLFNVSEEKIKMHLLLFWSD